MEEKREEKERAKSEKPREAVDWSALFEAMSNEAEKEMVADLLAARARALAVPEGDRDAEVGDVYTLFSLGTEKYALSAAAIEEVVNVPKLTPVPKTPPLVAGLFHRRGGVYLALDTRRLFDLEDGEAFNDALVLAAGAPRVALLVDAVTGTRNLPPRDVRPGDVGGRAFAGVTLDRYIVLDGAAVGEEVRRALGLEEDGG